MFDFHLGTTVGGRPCAVLGDLFDDKLQYHVSFYCAPAGHPVVVSVISEVGDVLPLRVVRYDATYTITKSQTYGGRQQ